MPALAVVDIEGRVAAALVLAFLITFAGVCFVGWRVLRSGKREGNATTWRFDVAPQVQLSKTSVDRMTHIAGKLARPLDLSPETRATLDAMVPVRDTLRQVYRGVMILIGLLGIAAAVAMFLNHDGANMLGLPGGIVLLLSLGAILEGLMPKWRIGGKGPVFTIPPDLLDKIDVRVSTQPLTVRLSEADLETAKEMLRRGSTPDEIVRAVYPAYDQLGEFERDALKQTLAQALEQVLRG